MGKVIEIDEDGLPIPQKVKVPKSSIEFDEDGLPIPIKKKVSIADVGMAARGGGEVGASKAQSSGLTITGEETDFDRSLKERQRQATAINFDDDDPVKSSLLPIENRIAEKRQRQVSSSTSTPVARISESLQNKELIEAKKQVENSRFGTTEEAVNFLLPKIDKTKLVRNKPVDMTRPDSLDDYTEESILEASLGDNLTANKAAQQYIRSRQLKEDIYSSNSLSEAAIKDALRRGDITSEQINLLGGNIPNAMKGDIVMNFLQNPDLNEEAQKNPELLNSLRTEIFEFPEKHPMAAVKMIAQIVSKKREDKGYNNGILNLTSKETTDEIVDELVESGKLPVQYKYLYERPEVRYAVNSALKTPGLVENLLQSTEEGVMGIGKTAADILQVRKLYSDKEDRSFKALEKQYSNVQFKPKGLFHETMMAGGIVTGQVLPMMGGGSLLKASGLINNTRTATAIMAGMQSFGNNMDRALIDLPGESDMKQVGYATTLTGIEVALANVLNDTKLANNLLKGVAPEVKSIVNKFTNKEISAAAAKQGVKNLFIKAIEVAPKFIKGTVNVAKNEANEEAATQRLQRAVNQAFGGESISESQATEEAFDVWRTTFLGSLFLGIGGGIVEVNKNPAMPKMLFEMASNPEKYIEIMKGQAAINEDYAKDIDQKLDNLQYIVDVKAELDGRNLKQDQKEKYLLKSLSEKILSEKTSAIPDKNLKADAEKPLRVLEIEKDNILNPGKSNTKIIEDYFDNDVLDGASKIMLADENGKFSPTKVGEYLKEIAQQSNGLDSDWKPLKGGKAPLQNVPEEIKEMASERWKKEIEAAQQAEIDQIRDLDMGTEVVRGEPEQISQPIELSIEPQVKEQTPTALRDVERERGENKNTYVSKMPKPEVPISEMNSEQLETYSKNVREYLKNQEIEFFGIEGAKKYRAARNVSNSITASKEAVIEADKVMKEMEDALPKEQYDDFFGINQPEGIYDPMEIRDVSTRVRLVEESENVQELGGALKLPLLDFSRNKNNEGTLAILNAAKKRTEELNLDPKEVFAAAIKRISNDIPDKNDQADLAKSIFEKLAQPKSESLLSKEQPAEDETKIKDSLQQKEESKLKEKSEPTEPIIEGSKKAGEEPPIEPPASEKKETKGDGGSRKKAVLNRLYNAKNVPQGAKEAFEKEKLDYEPASQKEAQQLAKAIIDEYGVDEALRFANDIGLFGGDVNTMIFAEALNSLQGEQNAKKWAEAAIDFDKFARVSGRAISAIGYFYKNNPWGVVLKENADRATAFEEKASFKKREQSWKEFFDESKENPEFVAAINEIVDNKLKQERASSRLKRVAKVNKVIDETMEKWSKKFSADLPKGTQKQGGSIDIFKAAGATMKAAYAAGEAVAKIVQDAIDYISEKLGTTDWDSEGFRKEWLEKFAEKNSEAPLTPEEIKRKVLDKFRDKLKGLSDKQQNEVVRKMFDKIVTAGALDYQDLRQIIADVLGYGELTDAESKKLRELVENKNAVTDAAKKAQDEAENLRQLGKIDDTTSETKKKAIEAQRKVAEDALTNYYKTELEAGKAARELQELLWNKPDIIKRLTSIMQLSTLGIPSLINNPIYNFFNQLGVRFPVGLVNDTIDRIGSGIAKMVGKNYVREYNILETQGEFWSKLGFGSKEALQQLFTGLNRQDYVQKELYGQQIRPARALKDLMSQSEKGRKVYKLITGKELTEKKLTQRQVIDKALQATAGVPAEIVARFLNIGDKPQRFAAEGSQAAAFAKSLGLKDIDYKIFIEFPREEAYRAYLAQGLSEKDAGIKADYVKAAIIKEGERSVFQQDNMLNDLISGGLNQLFGKLGFNKDSGAATLTKTITISPYIKIPSNAFWSYYNLVNPEIAMLQAAAHAGRAKLLSNKGDVLAAKLQMREARYWFAHGVTGIAMRGVVIMLVQAGIFIPGNTGDESKKERESESFFESPGSVNISKLKALLRGDDPSKIKGGYTVSNRWFGQFGMLGNSISRKYEEMTPEQKEAQDEFWNIAFSRMELDGLRELENGIFANSAGILQMIGGADASRWGLNTLNMFTNIFQPATFAQISRAQINEVPQTRGDTFMEKLNQNFAQRSSTYRNFFDIEVGKKRNIWGEPTPKGGNVLSRMFGVSKINNQKEGRPLYEDYLRTNNSGFLPPAVLPTLNGEKINTQQLDRLEELVGQERKSIVLPYVNDEAEIPILNKKYSELDDDLKISFLQYFYSLGREEGLKKFYEDYDELKPATPTIDQQVSEMLLDNAKKLIKIKYQYQKSQ